MILEQLAGLSSATLHEAYERKGALPGCIKPLSGNMKVCGRALTVHTEPGDNLALIAAIHEVREGEVIVADMGESREFGPFGEVLATQCLTRRCAGLVTTSSIRDSKAIIAMGFPVFSTGICIKGTAKQVRGTINEDIQIGGVTIHPGDYVLGDEDGVVVIAQEDVEEVVAKALERDHKEALVMERIRNNESIWDIYGYRR